MPSFENPDVHRFMLDREYVMDTTLKVLNSMHKIRAIILNERDIRNELYEEYSNLRLRLASGLEDMIHKDPLCKKNATTIIDEINKEQALLRYDPSQFEFWKKKHPLFCEALSNILILLTQDKYAGSDPTHHIFQALKYLIDDNQKTHLFYPEPVYGGLDIHDFTDIGLYCQLPIHTFNRNSPFAIEISTLPGRGILRDFELYAASLGYSYITLRITQENLVTFRDMHPDYHISNIEDKKIIFIKRISRQDFDSLPALIDIYSENKSANTFISTLSKTYTATFTDWFVRDNQYYVAGILKHYRGISNIQIFSQQGSDSFYAYLLLSYIKDKSIDLKSFAEMCSQGLPASKILQNSFRSDPVFVSFRTVKDNKKSSDLYAFPSMEAGA